MMKGVDAISRYIDPFIHKHLATSFIVRTHDVCQYPLTYNFNIFLYYSNSRHVNHTYLQPEHTTVSTVPTPFFLYFTPVCFYFSGSSIHNKSVSASLLSFHLKVLHDCHLTLLFVF